MDIVTKWGNQQPKKNDRWKIPEQNLENLVKSGPAKSWRNHGARENPKQNAGTPETI